MVDESNIMKTEKRKQNDLGKMANNNEYLHFMVKTEK